MSRGLRKLAVSSKKILISLIVGRPGGSGLVLSTDAGSDGDAAFKQWSIDQIAGTAAFGDKKAVERAGNTHKVIRIT